MRPRRCQDGAVALAPEDVWAEAMSNLPEGAVLVNAIVIQEYVIPGEEGDEGGPFLGWIRSSERGASAWRFIGMLELVKDTLLYRARDNEA